MLRVGERSRARKKVGQVTGLESLKDSAARSRYHGIVVAAEQMYAAACREFGPRIDQVMARARMAIYEDKLARRCTELRTSCACVCCNFNQTFAVL